MARFGSIPTQLDIPAGNFVRRNAGDTAFEAAGDVVIDGDFSSQGICLRGATPGVYAIMTGSSAVNTVEGTLTNDATHMPTSAAVYAAIGALPTYSFSNGLTETAGAVKLGGTLTQATNVYGDPTNKLTLGSIWTGTDSAKLAFHSDASVDLKVYANDNWTGAQTQISIGKNSILLKASDASSVDKSITISGSLIQILDAQDTKGMQYAADYSINGAAIGARWIPDKGYVDAAVSSVSYTFTNGLAESAGVVKLGGPLTGTTDLTNAVAGTYALNIGTSSNYLGAVTVNAEGISLIGRNNSNISFYTGTGLINLQGDTVITSTKVIGTQTSVDNTYSLAAYDTDGTAYTNFITFTAGTTPTMTFPQSGGGTDNYLNADGGWSIPPGTVPTDNILDWDGTAYAPYSAQTTGAFDSSATNPISAVNRLNFDGEFYAYNIYAANATDHVTITSGGQVLIYTGGADQMIFQPYVSDGAGAYGYSFDTENTLSTEGSKVAIFKNNSTEVFTVYGGGQLLISERALTGLPAPAATQGFIYMDSADDKLYFKNSATTYDLTSSVGSATFIGDTDTPADWTGGVGGWLVMVNSTPDAVEFIDPSGYAINNFSGTLTGNWTITGNNTYRWRVESVHAATGSVYAEISDSGKSFNTVSWSGADYTGGYGSLYVDDALVNLTLDDTSNQKVIAITASAMTITDAISSIGFQYAADYKTDGMSLGDRWIPDKGYVDDYFNGQIITITSLATDDIMKWSGSAWINTPIPTGGTNHALLSATHTDTANVAVTRGDIIYGDNSTQWNVLNISATATHLLRTDGTDLSWGVFNFGNLGTTPSVLGGRISDTKTNFNAACSNGTFMYVGDAPTAHSHGGISNTGHIGAAANLPLITGTAGLITTGTFGTAVYTFCVGNDARLSNARTPTAHAMDSATYHTSSDTTTLNATIVKHGFLKKLSNIATQYMNGVGNWTVPAGGAANPAGSDTHIQFNDSGAFGGSVNLTWDDTTLHIAGSLKTTVGSPVFYNTTDTSQRCTWAMNVADWISIYNYDETGPAFKNMRFGSNISTQGLEINGITGHVGITATPSATYDLYVGGSVYASGDIDIGAINATAKLYVYHDIGTQYVAYFDQDNPTGHGIRVDIDAASGTSYTLFRGYRSAIKIAELRSDGDWWAHDFVQSSDKRLKDVYQTVPDGLESVLKLNPVTYRWKDKSDDYIHTGFIAQEVQKLFPELVKDDSDGFLSLSYGRMSALAIAGVQGLNCKVDTIEDKLRKEIVDLKLRVKELEENG